MRMKLVIISHKLCWYCEASPTKYATDGGFPYQTQAVSELFDATVVAVPVERAGHHEGEIHLAGHNLSITPLRVPAGHGIWRKMAMIPWLFLSLKTLLREIRRADAVCALIPGDVGTLGMLLALALRKPLFTRYCGNWLVQRTVTERFLQWLMQRSAGGRNVMLATGGADEPPSRQNPNVHWIFASTMRQKELEACGTIRRLNDNGRLRLIIVCRQEPGKGTDLVIRSLPRILSKHAGTTLDVVGDGSALNGLKRLAEELGLSGRVGFHGKLDHAGVIQLMQEADLFCYPTASEGFPKVVVEALACGLPVITTRVSALPKLIAGGGGLLLEEAGVEAIAKAIEACVSNPRAYEMMSAKAIQTARELSLERWRDSLERELRSAWGPLACKV